MVSIDLQSGIITTKILEQIIRRMTFRSQYFLSLTSKFGFHVAEAFGIKYEFVLLQKTNTLYGVELNLAIPYTVIENYRDKLNKGDVLLAINGHFTLEKEVYFTQTIAQQSSELRLIVQRKGNDFKEYKEFSVQLKRGKGYEVQFAVLYKSHNNTQSTQLMIIHGESDRLGCSLAYGDHVVEINSLKGTDICDGQTIDQLLAAPSLSITARRFTAPTLTRYFI